MGPFMSQKTVHITLFTDRCAQDFFLYKRVNAWTVFLAQAHSGKPTLSSFVNRFLFTKT